MNEIEKIEFEFSEENLQKIEQVIKKYPEKREASAVLPLLYIAQEQNNGWIPTSAMQKIASILNIPEIKVYEVATFYSMFNLKPVGKYHIQVCGTTPCWLSGSDDIFQTCKDVLGIDKGETTKDGMFTVSEVECIGACVNAPVVQINNEYYYEDLNAQNFSEILNDLKDGKEIKCGSQIGRKGSEPQTGKTTLNTGSSNA